MRQAEPLQPERGELFARRRRAREVGAGHQLGAVLDGDGDRGRTIGGVGDRRRQPERDVVGGLAMVNGLSPSMAAASPGRYVVTRRPIGGIG